MNADQLTALCLAQPGAYLNCPFGPEPVCARIGRRIFAEIFITQPWVTLKCEPLYGQAMREAYPGAIRRGYHCPPSQHPYNNTITLDGSVPDAVLEEMVLHSYARALASLPRAQRADAISFKP